MAKRKRKNAPGAGRPPAGKGGALASTYPKTRIEPTMLKELTAHAAARGIPVWQVLSEAGRNLLDYARKMRAAKR